MQILLLLVLTVALYFAAALAGELLASQRIDRQVASISSDIQQLRTQNQRLTAAVSEAQSDAYVEREARDRLGLVRLGDVPVVIVNGPPPAASVPPTPPQPKAHWQNWAVALGVSR